MPPNSAKGNAKRQFLGYETFPLSYVWLKKTFDAVRESE